MKIPRNITGRELVVKLETLGYEKTRQTGSQIRLTRSTHNKTYHVTVPAHNPLRVGTFNSILKDVANHFNISKEKLIEKMEF